MSFSNSSIRPPDRKRPHIVKIGTFWRVSQIDDTHKLVSLYRWNKAHHYAAKLNRELHAR